MIYIIHIYAYIPVYLYTYAQVYVHVCKILSLHSFIVEIFVIILLILYAYGNNDSSHMMVVINSAVIEKLRRYKSNYTPRITLCFLSLHE